MAAAELLTAETAEKGRRGRREPRVTVDPGYHYIMNSRLWTIKRSMVTLLAGCLLLVAGGRFPAAAQHDEQGKKRDWPAYGGAPENNHYSTLTQINRGNVKRLAVAWSFDTQEEGVLQASPIVVDGVLYGISPTQKIFALDAATGNLLWKFDSGIRGTQPDRGLAYWSDSKAGDGEVHKKDKRILVGVMNFLYALDAASGLPIPSFGHDGRIDLRENLGREPAAAQSISMTSPGIVYKDLIIVGGRNPETLPAPPGDVRAFDVRTGKMRWSFHTIPRPGEFGYDTLAEGRLEDQRSRQQLGGIRARR